MAKKQEANQIRKLIKLNDELENYFRNTIIPQLFVDANLILRKFTPPAMQHFDLKDEHIGRPMEEMVDNIRFSTITENINHVIATNEILEKEIQTTDRRWFQMNIIPYMVKRSNKSNGVIITFVDITARMKVLKELVKLNATHETFIYSVSHDLRAPLANIEGLVNMLLKQSEHFTKDGNDTQKKIGSMVEDSVAIMRNIINDLSEIAKIEGNYKDNVEDVHLKNILQEVALTLKDIIIESEAYICLDIQEPVIAFSRKNLRSIIYNLLSNAIKYKSDRIPEIHISTKKVNDFIVISIKDNGLGISEEKMSLLFKPYSRIEKHVEGTGIGLYLIKKIVENEGGKIMVNSIVGEGTEFLVYLKVPVL